MKQVQMYKIRSRQKCSDNAQNSAVENKIGTTNKLNACYNRKQV